MRTIKGPAIFLAQFTGVGLLETAEYFCQSRLSGSVFAQQGMHFPAAEFNADALQNFDAAEGLADRAPREQHFRIMLNGGVGHGQVSIA